MMENRTDEQLMETYRLQGDRNVLGLLLRRHAVRARAAAFQLLRDSSEAQDAVQEAFVTVVRRSHLYKTEYAFAPWFFRLLRNVCLDIIRRRGAYDRVLSRFEPEEQDEAPQEFADAKKLRSLLEHLPQKERDALSLRIDAGMGLAEIASMCGCTEEAAKKRAQRGLQRIRRRYVEQHKHDETPGLPAVAQFAH